MDAFDSALAIIKSNGSYEAIFAAELSSGLRMSHTHPHLEDFTELRAFRDLTDFTDSTAFIHKTLTIRFIFDPQNSYPWIVQRIQAFFHSPTAQQEPFWTKCSAGESFVYLLLPAIGCRSLSSLLSSSHPYVLPC